MASHRLCVATGSTRSPATHPRTTEEHSNEASTRWRSVVDVAMTLALMPIVVDAMSADSAVAHVAQSIWALPALSLVFGTVAYTRDGVEFGRGAYVANLRWIWWAVPAGLAIRTALPFRAVAPDILCERSPLA